MHKIIFLAIDGTVTPWCHGERDAGDRFDSRAFGRLKKILDCLPDSRLVIAGDWGIHYSLERLRSFFQTAGIERDRVLDVTPDLRYDAGGNRFVPPRHEEIRAWLFRNEHILRFAIIDDVDVRDMLGLEAHYFQTDPERGLTLELADRVINHFGGSICFPFDDGDLSYLSG